MGDLINKPGKRCMLCKAKSTTFIHDKFTGLSTCTACLSKALNEWENPTCNCGKIIKDIRANSINLEINGLQTIELTCTKKCRKRIIKEIEENCCPVCGVLNEKGAYCSAKCQSDDIPRLAMIEALKVGT